MNEDGYYLYRADIEKNFGGDTWHEEYDDVDSQVEYEYGVIKQNWIEVDFLETGSALISKIIDTYKNQN